MADLQDLATWAEPLLAKLTQAERTKLARTLATELRRSQSQRIGRQQAPDGSAYAPRKPQDLRAKKGAIKAKLAMFNSLRTAKYLKTEVTREGAAVGFVARVARIARVHQEGERDAVQPGGPFVVYAKRELLGFSQGDLATAEDLLLKHLAGN